MIRDDLLDWWVNYYAEDGLVYFKDIPDEYKLEFNNFMIYEPIKTDTDGFKMAQAYDVGRWVYLMVKPQY